MRDRFFIWSAGILVMLMPLAGCGTSRQSVASAQLQSISLRPAAASAAPGTALRLETDGKYSDGATVVIPSGITWSSSDPSIVMVTSSGLAVAVAPGSAVITAAYQTFSASAVLTCSPVASLSLVPADPVIAEGTEVQFKATGTLQNGAFQDLTALTAWSSSDPSRATVSPNGLARVASTTTGTATITATFGPATGSTTITAAALTSLAITPTAASIVLGTDQQFTAKGVLSGGATQDLTAFAVWDSAEPTVAVISSGASAPGRAASVGAGTSVITASYSGITSNAAVLTVKPAQLQSIRIAPLSASIAVGKTQQFTATGVYSDNTTHDVTSAASWASSNATVASIGTTTAASGLATALAQGTTSISAAFSGVTSNSATLRGMPAVLTSIKVLPATAVLALGSSLQFTATGTFSDGSVQDMTTTVLWEASNVAVSISNTQGTNGLATAASTGTATITATSGSISGSAVITITF